MIVGDVNAESALRQVQKYFGDIKSHPTPVRNDVTEFENIGYRHMEQNTNVEVPNLYMAWNVKSLATTSNPEDVYALTLIRSLLDSGISSRLQQRLVRDKKLATALSVSYDPYNRGDSLFSISALPVTGVELPELQKAIEYEIERLKTELVQPQELERISTRFVANLIYGQDDIVGQAKMIGNLAVNGLNYRLMDQLPQHFEAVTPEDIQHVAQTAFVRDNLSTLYLQPEKKATK